MCIEVKSDLRGPGKPYHKEDFMKGKFSSMGRVAIALVLALSLSLVTAVPVSAAYGITPVTPTDITVGASYTPLTGPVIAEGLPADIGIGTIVLTAPAGFEFDTTASSVTAIVTGDATQLTLTVATVTPTTSTITIDVSAVSVTNPSTITYTGISIKDSDDTSGDTGNLVFSGTSNVTGSAGTLTSVPDVVATLTVTTQPTATVAGVEINDVTVLAVDT